MSTELEVEPVTYDEFLSLGKCDSREEAWAKVDEIERRLLACGAPLLEFPLHHVRGPGWYVREIFMPRGAFLTSKIHKTEHPFVISLGSVSVWTAEGGVVRYHAPYTGVTKPNTRRVLFIHEDTIWSTFHLCSEDETLEEIEERIITPHTPGFSLTNKHVEGVLNV